MTDTLPGIRLGIPELTIMHGTDPTDVADYILDALTERSWHAPSRDHDEVTA